MKTYDDITPALAHTEYFTGTRNTQTILCFFTSGEVRRSSVVIYYKYRCIRSMYNLTMWGECVRPRVPGSKYKITGESCWLKVEIWGRTAANVSTLLVQMGSSLVGVHRLAAYFRPHSDVAGVAGIVYYLLDYSPFTSHQGYALVAWLTSLFLSSHGQATRRPCLRCQGRGQEAKRHQGSYRHCPGLGRRRPFECRH